VQEGDRRHRQRFDVRSDDNWTMRASPETWDPLSAKLAHTVLQGGPDKLPRGTKLALSAGEALVCWTHCLQERH
jgi:hypothetical protein